MPSLLRTLVALALVLQATDAWSYLGYFVLSNNQPGAWCQVNDMTANGQYLAGSCQPAAGQDYQVTRWVGNSPTLLGTPGPGYNQAFGYAVSGNGSVAGITGSPFPFQLTGFRWNGTFTLLPPFGSCLGLLPLGISDAGHRLVGGAQFCTPPVGNGSFLLEAGVYRAPDPAAILARDISPFGDVIVGGGPAFRWDAGVSTPLVLPVPGESATATAVSPDGSVVVGQYDADLTAGTDWRQVLWGPNGFQELGAADATPMAAALPDSNGLPVAVVGGAPLLLGGSDVPTIWTEAFGVESLEARLVSMNLPASNLVSATGISDDGRYIVGSFQVGASEDESLGFAAIIPQYRLARAGFFGSLDISGYVRLQEPDPNPPDRLVAQVDFFGTTGGLFASGLTAAPTADPSPLFEELSVAQANLEYATEPLVVWTFEYDGSLDAPLEFTTGYPPDPIVPSEEVAVFRWDPDTQGWVELKRTGIGDGNLTVLVPDFQDVVHLAFGRTLAACADDKDNDGDGTADWDGVDSGGVFLPPDPQCTSAVVRQEGTRCGLGPELVLVLLLLHGRARRR